MSLFIERFIIVKMSVLHRAIYRFNTVPIKTPAAFYFLEKYKIYPQISMELQGHQRAKTILIKDGLGELTF